MEPLLLLALAFAALGTAALSATFGMAGGLLLMGVYTALLPVPEAMVLHGITQLVANGGRAWLLRVHVRVDRLLFYAAGALVAWALLREARWSPDRATVYLGIGAVPFVALLLPPTPALDFARRRGAAFCGLLVAGVQLAFGVAGPLLDVFFVRTALLRHQVVATKATTQTMSHALKIAFFAPLLVAEHDDVGDLGLAAGVSVLAAIVGTRLGGTLLDRLGEDTFRRWTRRLVLALGAAYLAVGLSMIVRG